MAKTDDRDGHAGEARAPGRSTQRRMQRATRRGLLGGLVLGLTLASGLAVASSLVFRFEVPGVGGAPSTAPSPTAQGTNWTVIQVELDGGGGDDIFLTDGTEAGTVSLIANLGLTDPDLQCCINLQDGRLLFMNEDSGTGESVVYVTSGVQDDPIELARINSEVELQGQAVGSGQAIFVGAPLNQAGNQGVELWMTDGTPSGTAPYADFFGGGSLDEIVFPLSELGK